MIRKEFKGEDINNLMSDPSNSEQSLIKKILKWIAVGTHRDVPISFFNVILFNDIFKRVSLCWLFSDIFLCFFDEL